MFKTRYNSKKTDKDVSWRVFLPYQLIKIKNKWLPLNREYKPLGLTGYNIWADYEKYDFLLIPEDEVDISYLKEGAIHPRGFYLYNDCTVPENYKMKKRYLDLCIKTFSGLGMTIDEYF